MSQANDSFQATPGLTGPLIATNAPGDGKEYQVVAVADDKGHLAGTVPTYSLFVPSQAVGANKVFFDLFNATSSGKTLRVKSLLAIKDGSASLTGTLSVKLHLTRTSAVGTGGTAATAEGTSLTAATISKMNPADSALPSQVTARSAPTGGATAGAVISERHIFTEETNGASYEPTTDFVNASGQIIQPVVVPENTGIRIVQGSVASAGNIGFQILFEAV